MELTSGIVGSALWEESEQARAKQEVRPLSISHTQTHARACMFKMMCVKHLENDTHTHTPGFYYVDTVHLRTFPEEFIRWRERPRLICLSSCEERGYMSYEENGIGHTHAHTYTYRSHDHTYTYRSHTRRTNRHGTHLHPFAGRCIVSN